MLNWVPDICRSFCFTLCIQIKLSISAKRVSFFFKEKKYKMISLTEHHLRTINHWSGNSDSIGCICIPLTVRFPLWVTGDTFHFITKSHTKERRRERERGFHSADLCIGWHKLSPITRSKPVTTSEFICWVWVLWWKCKIQFRRN